VTLIYFQRKLTGIYFTVSVRTPAFYSPFRGFHRAALSTRAETREQEARTWRIFYGKNGGPGSLSRFWPSEAATGTDVAGIGNTCHRKMHKLETRSCGGGRERERERDNSPRSELLPRGGKVFSELRASRSNSDDTEVT